MSRILKTSGFLALSLQAIWGVLNVVILGPGGITMQGEQLQIWIGAHAHFGILAILAIVLGFTVDHYDVTGTRRTAVTWMFILVQWLLPANFLAVAFVSEMTAPLAYLWGLLLLVTMLIMTQEVWTTDPGPV